MMVNSGGPASAAAAAGAAVARDRDAACTAPFRAVSAKSLIFTDVKRIRATIHWMKPYFGAIWALTARSSGEQSISDNEAAQQL